MADYNLKIIDNKVIFDGHAENSSDCHTLTLLCNLLQKNTKTIDYRAGYAEFELDDIPSENRFWLTDLQTFYINGILVRVIAEQSTSDAFRRGGTLTINLSFSQDGVTVHNTGSVVCKVGLFSDDLDLNSYFSVTSVSSVSAGGTALLPFLDNIKLRSILSSDGQEVSEGDVISDDGIKLTVSKIKSIDLATLPGWSALSSGSHSITIVAKADGYRNSEPSEGVTVTKAAEDALAGTWVFNDSVTLSETLDFSVSFISNSTNYNSLSLISGSTISKEMQYGGTAVYGGMGWNNEAYKTITITSKLSEVENGDTLLTWLQANATKQSTTEPTLISFTIAGTSYQAEEGMTWGEWVDSSYNTDGFAVFTNTYIALNASKLVSTNSDSSGSVLTSDVIESNYSYQLAGSGSGN